MPDRYSGARTRTREEPAPRPRVQAATHRLASWSECQMNKPATASSHGLGLNAWNYRHAVMLYGLYEQENWSQQQPQEGLNAQSPSLVDRRFRDRGSGLDRSRQRDDRWHGVGHPGRHRRHLRVEDVAYVCSHRYYSSRRACWWRPGGYYRPYRR